MIKKITMYRTSDGLTFTAEKQADEHELYLWFVKKYEEEYGNYNSVEGKFIFRFLMLNKKLVVDLYDKESNICT